MICVLLIEEKRKRKKREKWPRGFLFSQSRHTLLAVLGRIFWAVRCIKSCFKGQSLSFMSVLELEDYFG
jgi:hypothetical protein